uniref:C45 family autoproteolytic acyltransferase/hydolase n=1 Tax=uncultured Allobacillus sp. TaxID=1638025 RepID=UPI002599C98A|nr:C45 family peptidase [uncultured Allobacillus sp.]
MITIQSDIKQFRGTHYELGYRQGEELKDSPILKTRHKYWKLKRPRFHIDIQEAKSAFMHVAPKIWDEFEGIADGSKQPLENVLRDFGGYRMEPERSGCSVFVQDEFLVRNYDFQPATYDGRYMVYQPADGGHAVIGPSSRVTGRMDGMNEHGLAIGYNFTHRKKTKDGFVCYMISRMILELCENVDQAIKFLKELPHRNAFSYILLDQTGTRYIVEASPRDVTVRQASECTNHFVIQEKENRHHIKESQARLEKINELKPSMLTPKKAFETFNAKGKGVFSDNYKSWSGTIHTSLYQPQELKAWMSLGGNEQPEIFNFREWLNGNDFQQSSLTGKLETNIPTANMER